MYQNAQRFIFRQESKKSIHLHLQDPTRKSLGYTGTFESCFFSRQPYNGRVDRSQFLKAFQELLEMPNQLDGSERLEDLEGWDSVVLISFIAMVDEQFGHKISPRDIGRCETVDNLYSLAKNEH